MLRTATQYQRREISPHPSACPYWCRLSASEHLMANDILKRALDAFESNTSDGLTGPPLEVMRERRSRITKSLALMLDGVMGEKRELLASENRDFDRARVVIAQIDERIGELEVQE
ncbi:MAG: hypothetical protein M3O28_10935, partial [Actinomycetota bacterium]|nr:hypothetical protein [Actinomycetota bacterium]